MTEHKAGSILDRKAQWEREAVEAAEKQIAGWLRDNKNEPHSLMWKLFEGLASKIERGEYKSEAKG